LVVKKGINEKDFTHIFSASLSIIFFDGSLFQVSIIAIKIADTHNISANLS
jgi:hypothetical protein